MRIKIKKLYSVPETFVPILFEDGINLILGEKVKEIETVSRKFKKTNGVGKSICIEFINFCLLKSASDSRVMLIPPGVFPKETKIALDLIFGEEEITIIRTPLEAEKPVIIREGKEVAFSKISDAIDFLTQIIYSQKEDVGALNYPTFRQLLGPLIRDEDSEFKEIIHCYGIERNIPEPDLVKPHLYFFGIDLTFIDKIQDKFKNLTRLANSKSTLEKEITDDGRIKISDAKSEINVLNDELEKIKSAVDIFETNEAYESIQKDLIDINDRLDKLRSKQVALRLQIKKINSLPKIEEIQDKEIEIIYNEFKAGLGDAIVRSMQEAIIFKKRIDDFQNKIMKEKLTTLGNALEETTKAIRDLDQMRSVKIQAVDQKGVLKDLKNSYSIYDQKNNQYKRIRTQYEEFERIEREIALLNHEKDELLIKLDTVKYLANEIIDNFNKSILEIHEFIMGSNKASFDIKVFTKKNQKQIVQLDMRIDDDRSRSVEREKVFIYDLALMFNEYTRKKHPKFLVHDNIFDVDQDTLVQSLNYLAKQEEENCDFQYILTLNRDKIESEEREKLIKLDIEAHIRASFTKQNQFLGKQYQEI